MWLNKKSFGQAFLFFLTNNKKGYCNSGSYTELLFNFPAKSSRSAAAAPGLGTKKIPGVSL
jgi:hypothetical protein